MDAASGGVENGGSSNVANGGVDNGGSSNVANGGAANGTTGGAIPLANYMPVGAPIALASVTNASDIAWKPSTDTFFVLADRVNQFYEYDADFRAPRRTIQLVNRPEDAEGLTYIGSTGALDRFALSTEAPNNMVWVFELDSSATSLDFSSAVRQRYEPIGASLVANRGLEGVALEPSGSGATARFYVCEEGEPGQEPIRVLRFAYDPSGPASISYRDGALAVQEPFVAANRFDSAVGDLSGLYFDQSSHTLLVLSHLGSRVLRVAPDSGEVLDQMLLSRSPQYEGVTMASRNRLVFVSEPNFIEIYQAP